LSKIALSGNASGTGTLTIAAPNTSTDRTLTLPDNTGTIVTTGSSPSFPSTIGVGGATPAASGAGITFPAAVSASSDANTLDDYERGTWTPTYIASTSNPTVTYQAQNGLYVKIGQFVFFSCELETSAVSGGGGGLRIAGLPFTTANARYPGGGVATFATQFTNNSPDAGYAGQNTTHINLTYHSSATSSLENNNSDLTNGVSKNFLLFVGSYRSS
jgi:hypothetical protein